MGSDMKNRERLEDLIGDWDPKLPATKVFDLTDRIISSNIAATELDPKTWNIHELGRLLDKYGKWSRDKERFWTIQEIMAWAEISLKIAHMDNHDD